MNRPPETVTKRLHLVQDQQVDVDVRLTVAVAVVREHRHRQLGRVLEFALLNACNALAMVPSTQNRASACMYST